MKVLIVTGIFPPDPGGPASYVPQIALGLQKYGHSISAIITLSDDVNTDDSGYPFPVVRLKRNQSRLIRWPITILKIAFFAQKADLLYLNGLVCEGVIATKIFARRPVIIKVVGDLIWEKFQNKNSSQITVEEFSAADLPFKWRFLRHAQKWYMKLGDAIITPSHYLAKIVRSWGVHNSKIHTIYNAVAPKTFSISGQDKSDYDVVSVARLVPWKGLEELVEIAAEMTLRLYIIGDGPLRKKIETHAKKCGTNINFGGYIKKELIASEIRRAKLFVLNSSYEGLPHIVLEAKAAGVAVIATAVGGTPETICHGVDGWLVPPKCKKALARAIAHLLKNDSLRIELATAGRKQVAEQFSLKNQWKSTAALFTEVCK